MSNQPIWNGAPLPTLCSFVDIPISKRQWKKISKLLGTQWRWMITLYEHISFKLKSTMPYAYTQAHGTFRNAIPYSFHSWRRKPTVCCLPWPLWGWTHYKTRYEGYPQTTMAGKRIFCGWHGQLSTRCGTHMVGTMQCGHWRGWRVRPRNYWSRIVSVTNVSVVIKCNILKSWRNKSVPPCLYMLQ